MAARSAASRAELLGEPVWGEGIRFEEVEPFAESDIEALRAGSSYVWWIRGQMLVEFVWRTTGRVLPPIPLPPRMPDRLMLVPGRWVSWEPPRAEWFAEAYVAAQQSDTETMRNLTSHIAGLIDWWKPTQCDMSAPMRLPLLPSIDPPSPPEIGDR